MIFKCLLSIQLAFVGIVGLASPNDSLVIAWSDFPRAIDPRYAVDANSQYLENLLHCSLVDFDHVGQPIPSLAKEWKWINPQTLALTLTDKARFADGRLVTSADVKATFDFFRRKDIKTPTPRAHAFRLITNVEASPQKVIIHLSEPDSTILVDTLSVGILPQSAVSAQMITEESKVRGCGPFVLSEVGPSHLILERSPHYMLGPIAKIKKIVIKIVKDEGTRFSKLRAGEVDIVQNGINHEKLANIEKNYPSLRLVKRPGLRTSYIGFNFKDSILQHRRVRQAIAKSINKDAIIRHILKGLATKSATMLGPDHHFYSKASVTHSYDPESARRLLDDAGFKPKSNGMRFQLTYKTTQSPTRIAIGKAIASDFRKIGIELKVQALEWGRFLDDVQKGRLQIWGLDWVGYKDPDILRYAFASESFPPNGGNRGRFYHREFDQIAHEARIETNSDRRMKLYQALQEIIAQELPYAFLWHEDVFAVINKRVQNFAIYADGRYGALKRAYKM